MLSARFLPQNETTNFVWTVNELREILGPDYSVLIDKDVLHRQSFIHLLPPVTKHRIENANVRLRIRENYLFGRQIFHARSYLMRERYEVFVSQL